MTPTAEQTAIVEACRLRSRNLLVEARAGAAKTTTLKLIAAATPECDTLALAFNREIARTLAEEMPAHVTAKTFHSLGLNSLKSYIGKWPKTVKGKVYGLLKEFADKLEDQEERKEIYDDFSLLLKTIGAAKAAGYLGASPPSGATELTSREDFYEDQQYELSPIQVEAVDTVLHHSLRQSLGGVVDFDDMVLCAAVIKGCSFDRYDMVLVDEAQDLNMVQHAMLRKIVRSRTFFVGVGDPFQAIYGFRGAEENSMRILGQMFDCETKYLTTSFRCSKSIVENVHWRAPDMRWPTWASTGSVRNLASWKLSSIEDGDVIICRNNAPLFSLAIKLLRNGQYPEIAGRDMVKGLIKKMKGIGSGKTPRDEALILLDHWAEKEAKKLRDHRLLADMKECMAVFIGETETLAAAMAFAEAIADRAGRIQLMTGHKAKGLEWPKVYFLDAALCKQKGQDPNIRYVIETRAKEELIYVNLDELVED